MFRWSATGAPTRVAVDFEGQAGETTRVTVREGAWESDAEGSARYGQQTQGWVHMLMCLKAYLEYDRINLRGGSYGTRAALVYMRRHPKTIRAKGTVEGLDLAELEALTLPPFELPED